MTIAAGDNQIFLRAEEPPEFVALVLEAGVGMIIVLAGAIGADDGRRSNEDLERGIRRRDRAEEPRLLLRA